MRFFCTLAFSILLFSMVGASDYFVEEREPPIHPIDARYEGKLDFMGTNSEMVENIWKARGEWTKLMKERLSFLLDHLPEQRRTLLSESQDAWERALKADEAFFFDDSVDLRYSIGREGEILSRLEFMNRVRKRALDLTEYAKIFVEFGELPNK